MSQTLAFVRLQQLISPSLPVGAFTYSQGMEWAVEAGWIKTPEDVFSWLQALLEDALLGFDLPLLERLYLSCAEGDETLFAKYAALTLAGRETAELRLEEAQRARALVMILNKLPEIDSWTLFEPWQAYLKQSQLAGFAMACVYWQIPLPQALTGFVWSWLENMVTVAVKLIPLGQSDGQRILYRLSGEVETLCDAVAGIGDDEIGASTPALAIASSQHETQYCRLFRS